MGRNTIDNNNLEHGLGIGGGRGRPKGSRNGYINPNAAYMKNYEIQGEVADPLNTGLQPQNQQRQRTWAPAPQSNGPTRRMTNQEINTRKAAANNTARTATASRPATSVQGGKMLMEKLLKEQIIPEETIKEQYLTEDKPDDMVAKYLEKHPEYQPITANYQPPELNLKKPDPLADAWNGLLDWGKNAWNDISEAATSAIDTGKGWAKSGLDWLNNNILDPASKWGSQAVSDVSNWIGDRGRDLDRWWNGYDSGNAPAVQDRRHGVANDQYVQSHVNGFRENAGNAINGAVRSVGNFVNGAARDAGQWIGDRAEDADRWWNGYDSGNAPAVQDRRHGVANDQHVQQHVNGFRENAANAINGAVRDAGNAVNSAARSAGEFATRAANDVGQFVSDRAQDAVDLAGTTIQKVVDAAGNIKDAVVDGYGNVIGFLETNVGEPVDRFLNGTTTYSGEYNPETGESVTTETHTPGFLENAGSFISALPGQAQAAAGEAIRTITDAYGNVRKAVVDGAGNFVRWADNAVQDARIGASGVINQEPNTFGGMTNSIVAQNARAAGLSPARIARLADVYGPNNVFKFDSVLEAYAKGDMTDEQIDEIIRNK